MLTVAFTLLHQYNNTSGKCLQVRQISIISVEIALTWSKLENM